MVTVLATCAGCGQIHLAPSELLVVRYTPTTGWFRFACPTCGEPTTRDANSALFALVATAGVAIVDVTFEHADGPPIGLDDLIDLAADLARI